ncbi:metal-sensitive transcriptional regulator [Gordonia sp. VNK21]|uniref:metal-sensitive transcriptional regulator n=1 Tax=Gordonia sp. VNK21 TaxID=3382483 RepID=UPI0038D35A65
MSEHDDQDPAEQHAGHGYIADKQQYIRRLKLIEGQARGLQRMVENEEYCIDILTQLSSMTRALQAVGLGLLDDHLGHCVVGAARESDAAAAEKIDEAMKAITRLVKS